MRANSPLPRLTTPAYPPVAYTEREIRTLCGLLKAIRPRPVTVVIGSATDGVSTLNAVKVRAEWSRHGVVLDTVTWPETAASWLRQARRFTSQAPDAWIVTGTLAGWIGMGRRLAHSTDWEPRRTVAMAGLAHPNELIRAGGVDTFDGPRGTRSDGSTWEICRTVVVGSDHLQQMTSTAWPSAGMGE